MKDKSLLLIVLGVVLLLGLLWAIADSNGTPALERVKEFDLPATASARPGEGRLLASSDAPTANGPGTLRLYLDVSHPMAGFLNPSAESSPDLRVVAQMLPGHLHRLYGTGDVVVRWWAVATDLVPLRDPVFEPRTFRGARTHLDLALSDALEALQSGESEVAVLITDLVATRHITGALGASKALYDWVQSPEVLSSRYDVGLLGIRASYRGVTSTTCPKRVEGLGCWYSEGAHRYVRITEPVKRPFYVLILGRSSRNGASGVEVRDSLVERLGMGLKDDVEELGFDVQWELLTATSRPIAGRLRCRAETGDAHQHALWRAPNGRFKCQQDEEVLLICEWGSDATNAPSSVEIEFSSVALSWPQVTPGREGERVSLRLDCEELRRERPQTDLCFEPIMASTVRSSAIWDEWSCASDELENSLNRTLQLKYFVESLKPDEFQIKVHEPILKSGT